jgi:hypothetical protein
MTKTHEIPVGMMLVKKPVGKRTQELLLNEPALTLVEIKSKLDEEYPERVNSPANIYWYKARMRKNGLKPRMKYAERAQD